ncbi:hypothetical protein [Pyxidicoccus xibeiensis]|uniref:hypothetical protein n=1 Tax=Pyxidicoccus xibeiensis TaxID=2906759 RepID=UPI0020A6E871|nr:hypothetical protein [Pyxidicoccus xibeiensis]MCP3138268.1 hypothetical protein [Pyxidicoccus xibeiensis]
MSNWKRLEKLNGGEPIWYSDPVLDTKDEVWFFAPNTRMRELCVWSQGVRDKHDPEAEQFGAPVTGRVTLYDLRGSQLYVDVEFRGDQAVLRRGVLNGASLYRLVPAGDIEALLARYRALGFREGTPWNVTKNRVTVRQYLKGTSTGWSVHVDGASMFEGFRNETPAASREAAIAGTEKCIRAREKAGFRLYNIELTSAAHPNPEPKPAKGTPTRAAPPKGPTFAKPKNAYEAVDTAIAMLRDLHERIPTGHFVAELIDVKKERKRVASVEPEVAFFTRMHKQRLGRWKDVKAAKPGKKESSWSYFLRVYGSITWILDSAVDDELPSFLCGNIAGGGWSCLEIADELYDTDSLVEATGNTDLEDLQVFHGGWHTHRSFAFDPRAVSPTGERPIIPFDESLQKLPRATKAERIQPFGLWLHKHVSRLVRTAERNLREVL